MSSSYYNFDFQTIIISSLWNHIVFPTTMYDPGVFVPNRWKWMDIWTSGLSSQVQSTLSSCTNTPGKQSDPPKKNLDVDKKFPKPSKLLHTHTHTHTHTYTHTHEQAMSVWMGHFSKWDIPYIYIIYVTGHFVAPEQNENPESTFLGDTLFCMSNICWVCDHFLMASLPPGCSIKYW